MRLMNHLRKTTDGTWEVRIVVPPEVRGVIGKNNLTKRLGRITKSEANALAAPLIAEFQSQIAQARRDVVPERTLTRKEQREQKYREAVAAWRAEHAPGWEAMVEKAAKKRGYTRTKAPAAVPLRELFAGYVAERKPAPATVARFGGVIDKFIKHMGHDNAAQVTPDDVVAWKASLLDSLSGKTVKEIYLSALKVVFSWAAENRKLETNPVAGITVRVPKQNTVRSKGFTPEEAERILKAATDDWDEALPAHYRRARRWVPWVCAYSGARIGEVTQMRGCDVFEREGFLVMRVTPEAGRVKDRQMRLIPVHEDLRAQGFLVAVRSAGDGPLFYDPNEPRKGPNVKYTLWDKSAAHVRAFVRTVVDDPNVSPNHGWRHTFKTIAREAGLDTACIDVIVGHARKTEGDRYGDWSIKARADQMAKFPRYTLKLGMAPE